MIVYCVESHTNLEIKIVTTNVEKTVLEGYVDNSRESRSSFYDAAITDIFFNL